MKLTSYVQFLPNLNTLHLSSNIVLMVVLFDKHFHVHIIHKLTCEVFCQREDEGHLFKVNYIHLLFYLNSVFDFKELLLASDKDVLTMYVWRDLWRLCKTLTHILHTLD